MTKLEELKAAFEASTQGEWRLHRGGTAYYPLAVRASSPDREVVAFHSWDGAKSSNAEFITLAHNLMPTLFLAVESMAELLEESKGIGHDVEFGPMHDRAEAILKTLGELK